MSEYDDVCNQVADETASQFEEKINRISEENRVLKEKNKKLRFDEEYYLKKIKIYEDKLK